MYKIQFQYTFIHFVSNILFFKLFIQYRKWVAYRFKKERGQEGEKKGGILMKYLCAFVKVWEITFLNRKVKNEEMECYWKLRVGVWCGEEKRERHSYPVGEHFLCDEHCDVISLTTVLHWLVSWLSGVCENMTPSSPLFVFLRQTPHKKCKRRQCGILYNSESTLTN